MLRLTAGPCSVMIDLNAGGRFASLNVYGLELLEQRNDGNHPFGWGSYVMVPFAGRVRNGRFSFDGVHYEMPANMGPHAIHGTSFDRPWDVLASAESWALLGTRIGGGLTDPWPFAATVTHLISLSTSGLTQVLGVTPTETAMPVTFGWHPWFRRRLERGGPLELDVDLTDASRLERDANDGVATLNLVDPGPRPWDDCFVDTGAITLHWPGALDLEVFHDAPFVVMYDPSNAICVEPQTGPPDAFNLGPDACRLEAGDLAELTVSWRWKLASRP
jgi:aldose 1-epimerase